MNKVSIIVPVYNAENFLNKCLDSIINQTYKDLEIICINDGSNDNSLDILKKYEKIDNRIIVFDIDNSGVSYARNFGINKSTGKYIMFVDSDDYIESNMVYRMIDTLLNVNADIVRCTNYKESLNSCVVEEYHIKNKLVDNIDSDLINDIINSKLLTYSCVLLIKKNVLMKTNLFNVNLKIYEDRVFYLELFLKANKIYFMDEALYHYVINDKSCTKSNSNVTRHLFDTINGWKVIYDILMNNGFESSVIVLNSKYLNMIMGYLYASYKFNYSKFVSTYNKVFKSDNVGNMINYHSNDDYSLYIRLSIFLLKNNKFNLLKMVYYFRKKISYLKK